MRLRYSPGHTHLLAGQHCVVLLPSDVDEAMLTNVWEQMSNDGDITDIMDVLLPKGLALAPSIALATWNDAGFHLVLRGTGHAVCGEDWLDAENYSTWRELKTSARSIRLSLNASDDATRSIPLVSGIVLVSTVTIQFDEATPAEPEPVEPASIEELTANPSESATPTESSPGGQSKKPDEVEDREADRYDRLFDVTTLPGTSSSAPANLVESPGPSPIHEVPQKSTDSEPVSAAGAEYGPELTIVRPSQMDSTSPTPQGEQVMAVQCPRSHLNPPQAPVCRVCAAGVAPQEPTQVPRPSLGALVALDVPTGAPQRLTLDSDLLIGRQPTYRAAPDPAVRLVTIRSPERDMSRRHVRISLDGWKVLVSDLGSANGTFVTIPGRAEKEVKENEACAIVPGTRVNIAGVATYTFEAE